MSVVLLSESELLLSSFGIISEDDVLVSFIEFELSCSGVVLLSIGFNVSSIVSFDSIFSEPLITGESTELVELSLFISLELLLKRL